MVSSVVRRFSSALIVAGVLAAAAGFEAKLSAQMPQPFSEPMGAAEAAKFLDGPMRYALGLATTNVDYWHLATQNTPYYLARLGIDVPPGFDVSFFTTPIPPLPNLYPNLTKFHGKIHVCRFVVRKVGFLAPEPVWECLDLTLELVVAEPEGPIWKY